MRTLPWIALLLFAAPVIAASDVDDRLKELESLNPAVRVRAVEQLAAYREPRVLVALLLALRDDDADVRARSAEALRLFGDRRAVPFLYRALGDGDPTVRCRAVLSLGELGDRYLVPSLTRMLADPVVVVRAAAVRALGELEDPLSLPVVLSAMRREEEDTNGSVTAAGLIACARLGGARGLDRALSIVGDRIPRRWFLRAVYARAVGVARDEGRADGLALTLAKETDSRVVQAAADSLALLGRIEPLTEATTSEDGFRRRAATAALARMDGPEAERILVRMVSDHDPAVALEAADALAGRGKADALPVLIRLLDVSDPPAWMGALASLQRRTGLTIDRNPPRWRKWFEANRDDLVFDRAAGVFRSGR